MAPRDTLRTLQPANCFALMATCGAERATLGRGSLSSMTPPDPPARVQLPDLDRYPARAAALGLVVNVPAIKAQQ